MHPILFHVGSAPVRAYSLAVMAAVIASSYFASWLGQRRGVSWAGLYQDFAVWALVGGMVGARAWEVAFNWSYYQTALHEVLAIWEGGLSIQGGILGGLAATWFYTRHHKVPIGQFLDGAAPALLLGQAIGRLFGCSLNGDAFGKPTGTGFGIVHAPGTPAYETFGAQPLWPAEVFEGLFDLAVMAFLLRLGLNRGPAGNHFLLYGLLYSAGRFALEFLRADTGAVLAGLSPAQLGSLGIVALCMALLLRRRSGVAVTPDSTGPANPS